uniref:Uncharacterized protein LOC103411209 n=1 Tax=Rhizophora mucronata TaxID=61149 RepID=A0A2P2LK40_RHIMU
MDIQINLKVIRTLHERGIRTYSVHIIMCSSYPCTIESQTKLPTCDV